MTQNIFNTPTPDTTVVETQKDIAEFEGKVVLTFKGGKGYDAPWVVVHSADVQAGIEAIKDPGFEELLTLVGEKAKVFNTDPVATAPQRVAQTPAARPGQPAAANQPPAWVDMSQCPPGYTYRSGVDKNGKPWHAFMSINRQPGAEPVWLYQN